MSHLCSCWLHWHSRLTQLSWCTHKMTASIQNIGCTSCCWTGGLRYCHMDRSYIHLGSSHHMWQCHLQPSSWWQKWEEKLYEPASSSWSNLNLEENQVSSDRPFVWNEMHVATSVMNIINSCGLLNIHDVSIATNHKYASDSATQENQPGELPCVLYYRYF